MYRVDSLNTHNPTDDKNLFEQIALQIIARGYAILPAAMPKHITDHLIEHLAQLECDGFRKATIGRSLEQTENTFVRRDKISWIDEESNLNTTWKYWCEQLRIHLNKRLFLGLFSFESHFALYLPGDFYKKHKDAFKGESNRILSLVTYLNKGWEPDQGGELVMYSDADIELNKVQPTFATLVVFLSEEFPHEVLPVSRQRYSVAGWFRVNNSINGQIDPPK
ncbi:MAG: SM-20-related protein [Lentisphaeria bacterium]|jgi:SM-20-related protein